MTAETTLYVLGIIVVGSPALLLAALGLPPLLGRPLAERTISRLTYASTVVGLAAAVTILVLMLLLDSRHVPIELGN